MEERIIKAEVNSLKNKAVLIDANSQQQSSPLDYASAERFWKQRLYPQNYTPVLYISDIFSSQLLFHIIHVISLTNIKM